MSLLTDPAFLKHFNKKQRKEFVQTEFFENGVSSPVRVVEPFRTQWIDALVSGAYTQATEALYDPDTKGFCCLGVGCDITHHTEKRVWKNILGTWKSAGKGIEVDGGLPIPSVSNLWFPDYVSNPNIITDVDAFTSMLAELNDSGEFSFTDIARVIDHCTVSA